MLNLNAKTREVTGNKVKILRGKGIIPAIVYGHGLSNKNIQLDYSDFQKLFDEAGENSLVELKIDKKEPIVVLIQDVQYDPLTGRTQHVDFHQIKAGEKIHAEIELEFIGESKAVKELGGILIKPHDKLEIKCLPKDLIHKVEVDISKLESFDDVVRIKDLGIPSNIEILDDLERTVALVAPPKKEEVVEEAEETVEEEGEENKETAEEVKEGEEKKEVEKS